MNTLVNMITISKYLCAASSVRVKTYASKTIMVLPGQDFYFVCVFCLFTCRAEHYLRLLGNFRLENTQLLDIIMMDI